MTAKIEYFDYLDTIVLNNVSIKDIYQRLNFIYEQLNANEDLLLEYRLKDYERPEDLAFRYYGDKRYYWILLLVNGMQDYFYDWLLTYEDLKALSTKYWSEGITLGCADVNAILEYLVEKNEEKRIIKFLNPKYFGDFLQIANNI